MKKIIIITLVVFCPFFVFAAGQSDLDCLKTISVYGSGLVEGQPDSVHLSFSVSSTDSEVKIAVDENSAKTEQLMGLLERFGMGNEAILSSQYSIWDTFESGEDPEVQKKVYQVSTNMELKLNSVDILSSFIDSLVDIGITQVWNIVFAVADSSSLEEEARIAALEDARNKAAQLAAYSNLSLGEIIAIQEGQTSFNGLKLMGAEAAYSSGPVNPGSLSYTETLTVTYSLVD